MTEHVESELRRLAEGGPAGLGFTPAPGESLDDFRRRVVETYRHHVESVATVDNVARWALSVCPRRVTEVTIRDQQGYDEEGAGIVGIDLHWSWWRRPWRGREAQRRATMEAVHDEVSRRIPVHLHLTVS